MPEKPSGKSPIALPHIRIDGRRTTAAYTPVTPAVDVKPARADHAAHARGLLTQLAVALEATPTRARSEVSPGVIPGALIEVETMAGKLRAKKLPDIDYAQQDIRLLQTRRTDSLTEVGVVFVPDASRDFLRQRMSDYGATNLRNRPRPHVTEFETIDAIRPADAASLFVGSEPFETDVPIWWELWAFSASHRLEGVARRFGIDVHPSGLSFPDIQIVFVHARSNQLRRLVEDASGSIAEIRRADLRPAVMLDNDRAVKQEDWVEDLVSRVVGPSEDAPSVCLHDTRAAGAHPLIEPGLKRAEAYDDRWGTDDHAGFGGHGTGMVSLALYGDLFFPLQDGVPHVLTHWAESIKILPPRGFPANEPSNYGDVTQGAVAKVEIDDPHRPRVHCLAITAPDFASSSPSSWSGAIDQVCSGSAAGDQDRPRRLFIVASGNTLDEGKLADVLLLKAIEDPAQSWNALTIGGYTTREAVAEPLKPAVKANERSPYGRGTSGFDKSVTPFKPEVVFEAGNMAVDAAGDCRSHDALSLVAAGSEPVTRPLVPFWATSAATGMAGNFMGHLMAELPGYWPETYRGLTVHSAEWTAPMRKRMRAFSNKRANHPLLREFGFGVPRFERALHSARNDVTLIAQAEIQPFALAVDGSRATFNEVHYYPLPWPRQELQRLENEVVEMKVTLSYFPEPNLSPRAATRPESYRSYGLRFRLKRRTETEGDFRRRINAVERVKGEKFESDDQAGRWLVGPGAISAGSVHSDVWRGPAVDLASIDMIAVHAVTGWWKTHLGQRKANYSGRYALLLSISARGQDIDLYSSISASLNPPVTISAG